MSISHYLKEIGRGARGAKPLDRADAADLFGQVLDGSVSDLEVGAFCLAMRIKGETPQELAGFLDATRARITLIPAAAANTAGQHAAATVVIPSYNGARRLPVLTPLLGLLLAREGLPVVVHGAESETGRIHASKVLEALDVPALRAISTIAPGQVAFMPTALLCPGLKRLLDVRQVIGLRNPAHSVAKLLDPCAGPAVVVASYTHAAYAESMAATFALTGATALLSRGMEGEVVADPRRTAEMTGFVHGAPQQLQAQAPGTAAEVAGLPAEIDVESTARYTRDVLQGRLTVPEPIARQVEYILRLASDAAKAVPAETNT